MTDRVLLGNNEADESGIWVSKPGANVVAIAGNTYLKSLVSWYGYQEEFDSDGLGEDAFVDFHTYSLGSANPAAINLNGFTGHGASLKKTSEGTLLYKIINSGVPAEPPVPSATSDTVLYSKGLSIGGHPAGVPGSDSFIGSEYPIVEMRLRRLHTSTPAPNGSGSDFLLYFFAEAIDNAGANMVPGSGENQFATGYPSGKTYKDAFPDSEVLTSGDKSPWRILEWDMSGLQSWSDTYAYQVATGGETSAYSSEYRITGLRWDLNNNAVLPSGTFPMADPLWEIDYVRVKKKGVPPGVGRYGSIQDSFLFDSNINHMTLVHQTGIVTIGTAKAWIDGTTSDRVVGHNIDNDANGYVSFPELDYIPLVLFQRIDENVDVTGASYAGGEDEYSVCIQNWEDHRYPTIDINTSEPKYKGFDIQTQTKVRNVSYTGIGADTYPRMYENFAAQLTGFNKNGPGKRAGCYHWTNYTNGIDDLGVTQHPNLSDPLWDDSPDDFGFPPGSSATHLIGRGLRGIPLYGYTPGPGSVGHWSSQLKSTTRPGITSTYPGWPDNEYVKPFNSIFYPRFKTSRPTFSGQVHQIRAIPDPRTFASGRQATDYIEEITDPEAFPVGQYEEPSGYTPSGYYPLCEHSEPKKLDESYRRYSNMELPWTGKIPLASARAGRKFSDMIESFSEVRTFAYTRAKKDGFWITCRNAIAQEGMEPALNLAPVMPEWGSVEQGSIAFRNMASNNDNGAWGMFHPALALYDTGNGPQKFTEGLQLKWDTRTTANSMLLNLTGNFPQYKMWPSFSCSGLPFDGERARPTKNLPKRRDTWPKDQWAPESSNGRWLRGKNLTYPFYTPHVNTTGWDIEAYPVSYDVEKANPKSGNVYDASYSWDFHTVKLTDFVGSRVDSQVMRNGKLKGDTGGFYPYRLQSNRWILANNYNSSSTDFNTFGGFQYNIKRISSPGIIHPKGIVPEHSIAFSNKNIDEFARAPGTDSSGNILGSDAYVPPALGPLFTHEEGAVLTANIYNQTSYIGGAMNTSKTVDEYFYSKDIKPRVSPDGTKIAFQSDGMTTRTGTRPKYDIWVMDIDGSNRTNLTACTAANDEWPSWNPSGTKIAFHSDRTSNKEIYTMNADGSGQTRITNMPSSNQHSPAWAPAKAGDRIAFVTDRDYTQTFTPTWAHGKSIRPTKIYSITSTGASLTNMSLFAGFSSTTPHSTDTTGRFVTKNGWFMQSPEWSPHHNSNRGWLAFIMWDVRGGFGYHSPPANPPVVGSSSTWLPESVDGTRAGIWIINTAAPFDSPNGGRPGAVMASSYLNLKDKATSFGGRGRGPIGRFIDSAEDLITNVDGEPYPSELNWGNPLPQNRNVDHLSGLCDGTKISYSINSVSTGTSDVGCLTISSYGIIGDQGEAPQLHYDTHLQWSDETSLGHGDWDVTNGFSGDRYGYKPWYTIPSYVDYSMQFTHRPRELTRDLHISNHGGSWTPDRKHIVFSSNKNNSQNPNAPSIGGGFSIYTIKDEPEHTTIPQESFPIKANASVSFDKTKAAPPKYRYWVLRIPVSISEYS